MLNVKRFQTVVLMQKPKLKCNGNVNKEKSADVMEIATFLEWKETWVHMYESHRMSLNGAMLYGPPIKDILTEAD